MAQEAEMYTYYRNCKPIVGVTLCGFALATLCKLAGAVAQGCSFLGKTSWVALEVSRSILLLEGWHTVSAYLFEDSRLLPHLLQIALSIWPLLCVMAGSAK
jgi:hypothetical protein